MSPRAHTLHKLVALAPITPEQAKHYTGWSEEEVAAAAYEARRAGLIARRPAGNQHRALLEARIQPEGWSK